MFSNWHRIFRLGELTKLQMLVFVALFSAISHSANAKQDSVQWRTGGELRRASRVAISGTWTDTPLRQLLQQISKRQRISLFIDRRVDPNRNVNLDARNLTWEQLLLEIGKQHSYFFCRLDDVYYFGPRQVCVTLPDVYENLRTELRERRQELRVNWLTASSANWPRLSQPRQLLQAIGQQHGVELYSDDQVAHDLWNEFSSPPIPLALQAILLTSGFGKTIVVSKTGQKLKIVDYPKVDECSWRVEHLEDARAVIREIKSDHTEIEMQAVTRRRSELSGKTDVLYLAIVALIGEQSALQGRGPVTFSLELRSTRGSALATMAQQLNVEFDYQPDAAEALAEFVELNFKDATAEEIIQGVVAGSGLSYQLDSKQLKIK